MTSDPANSRPTRRFASFSLRELCLLMLTVAAIAAWWRESSYRGAGGYSSLNTGIFQKAVASAVESHFAGLNGNLRTFGPSGFGGGESSSPRNRTCSYHTKFFVVDSQRKESPIIDWTERTKCEPSPLQTAIIDRIEADIEAIPGISLNRNSLGTSLRGDTRTNSQTLTYSFGSTQGILHVRVKETWRNPPMNDATNQSRPLENGSDSIEVEILLLEIPAMIRRGS